MEKNTQKSSNERTPYQQQLMKDVRAVLRSKLLIIPTSPEKAIIKKSAV